MHDLLIAAIFLTMVLAPCIATTFSGSESEIEA